MNNNPVLIPYLRDLVSDVEDNVEYTQPFNKRKK